jgi:hypothetical protein
MRHRRGDKRDGNGARRIEPSRDGMGRKKRDTQVTEVTMTSDNNTFREDMGKVAKEKR